MLEALHVLASGTCDLDRELPPAPTGPRTPRASDLILGGLVLGEAAILTYAKLRNRFKRIRQA